MPHRAIRHYYHSLESLIGYRLLGGIKHFGYYPPGQEALPTRVAQELMDEQIAQSLSLPSGSVILDAGCGEGGVSLYLAKRYHQRITGIDLLPFNISRAKRAAKQAHLTDQVTFEQADYSHTGLSQAAFDGIYTAETLVHSPDFRKTLDEFKRLLRPGGRVAFFEYALSPNVSPEAKQAFAKVNELAVMPAFNEFTYGVLEQALTERGFVSVETQDITDRIAPLLHKFERSARTPYRIASRLGLENHVVNAMSAIVMTTYYGQWRYNIVSARLPAA